MADASTIIGAGISISGRLEGAEDVQVFGHVKGHVNLEESALLVEKDGRVDAEVEAGNVEIRGILTGKVVAKETIELSSEARVIADLFAPQVVIQGGALFRGLIEMEGVEAEGPEGKDAPASTPARAPAKKPAGRNQPRGRAASSRATPSRATPSRASGGASGSSGRGRAKAKPAESKPARGKRSEPASTDSDTLVNAPVPPEGIEEKAVAVKPKD